MEALSELDRALLEGETPTQHLHVLATLVLAPDPAMPRAERFSMARERLRSRFHLVAPLRKRPVRTGFGGWAWVDDPDVDVDRHIFHTVAEPPGDLAALARITGAVASTPLPRDRPLWEAWYVEGLADDRTAMIAKIHHAALDGVSGFDALGVFFDLEPHPDEQPVAAHSVSRPQRDERVRQAAAEAMAWPGRLVRGASSLARVGAAVAESLLAEPTADELDPRAEPVRVGPALPLTAPRLSLNRSVSARRIVAFAELPLEDVRRVRKARTVKVNDVIATVTAGALRRYLEDRGELPDRPLIAAIPTSERLPEHGAVGNRFSTMFYALPVDEPDPIERLRRSAATATGAKQLYDRAGRHLLEDLACLAPPGLSGPALRVGQRMRLVEHLPVICNLLMSNVHGPELPLWLAGSRLEQMFPMGPVLEGIALGVTVASYRDDIAVGLIACAEACPDLDDLVAGFPVELARLAAACESAD